MNFLGHSLISLEIDENINKETLYGNFTGDFYKGLVERIELSENLKEGLERAFQGLAKNIRRGEILNLAVAELKRNYNLFEEKSIKEFFYVKNESIKEFSKKIF
ncbi:hypothetical protein [Fusobacterium sp. CM22]|uniref:hypothetical protein n=1 Tax=Fusobacterium sp. CM22 TaxID=936563 RepID=UPI000449E835|nr:hypothetical protein [Fusobacterium sp. CM22]EUB21985.1 hypothetical protein HMPREF1500_1285 [Fusobacterium sp. CM22]